MAMNDAKDRVCQLENAIRKLDLVKKHLNRNASDIKAEIHASVSRNLECLRGREVSLLSQVDQVLGIKEETLQQQQARLNQALGVIQTGLCMALEDASSEKKLADTLKKLDKVELSPEETPYISFRADHLGLRESILNYGRVDANGLPLITAFDDPGNPSASLPRHVEEYEDVDHHFFYKTLEEVRRSQNPGSCITVTIPKLSNRVEDWLQKKLPTTSAPDSITKPVQPSPAVRPCTLTRVGDVPTAGMSRSSTPGSSCSLNNWLNTIKQHVDQEEEHDFEIIDHSGPVKVSKEAVGRYNINLKLWLAPYSQMSEENGGNFFKHISKDKKIWLQQFHQQVTSLNELPQKDMFSHISKDMSTWLRSRVHAKNTSTEKSGHNFFSHISKDTNLWLLKQKSDKNMDVTTAKSGTLSKDVEKWLMPGQTEPSSAVKKDVLQRETAKDVTVELTGAVSLINCESKNRSKEIFRPLNLPLQNWLSPSSQKLVSDSQTTVVDMRADDFSKHIRETSSTLWLAKATTASTISTNPDRGLNQEKKPLQKELVSGLPIKPSSSGLDFCLSDWLLVPAELTGQAKAERDADKEESEGWSVCSDQTAISGQHSQDVAAATDYFNKWVF
ncbi:hypothetical protein Btru_071493 [Bulinus truncatus]|nr:hypothetical protein Btru_071493 [Bulinus truncatus]